MTNKKIRNLIIENLKNLVEILYDDSASLASLAGIEGEIEKKYIHDTFMLYGKNIVIIQKIIKKIELLSEQEDKGNNNYES